MQRPAKPRRGGSSSAPRLLLMVGLALAGFVALHWSVLYAAQSVARYEKGGGPGGRSDAIAESSVRGAARHSAGLAKASAPPRPSDRDGPLGADISLTPPGFGRFKLAGDPDLCKHRKWKWCYIRGNVETFRRVFGTRNPLIAMQETPPLPMDLEGGGPWQLMWQLADETSRDGYATTRRLKWFQKINTAGPRARQQALPDPQHGGSSRAFRGNVTTFSWDPPGAGPARRVADSTPAPRICKPRDWWRE